MQTSHDATDDLANLRAWVCFAEDGIRSSLLNLRFEMLGKPGIGQDFEVWAEMVPQGLNRYEA